MSDIKLTYFGQCEKNDRQECYEKLTIANYFLFHVGQFFKKNTVNKKNIESAKYKE